ncbi:MAG: YjjG family noncanonical pyrimidine nucleotidase [Flavobacteriales bacterium]|nr:YjjG family noncanonical pyrimidine nucleotidase [Flavobacteriales bacterium]
MKQIKHVFFDLDRTLWDFESNSEATLKELFSEFKLSDKLGVSDNSFIHEYKRINEIFWEDYRNGTIEKHYLRYGRFETALKYFGRDDKQMAAEIGELYISRSPRKTGLIDGSIEVLEYLKPNYQLHIITNGFEEVQHIKMESSGLSPYFQHIITSESAGAKKPSRIIFDHAEGLTGAVSANSLMIGDHFEADVIGAMESNWKAVFFEPEKPKMEDDRFIHIHHLRELMEIL